MSDFDIGKLCESMRAQAIKDREEIARLRNVLDRIARYEKRGPVAAAQLIAIAKAAL